MFYWFQRGTDLMRYEARETRDAYELVVVGTDGSEKIERFKSSGELRQRELELISELAGDGWEGPHGWNV
jgi:hypothetical protein